MALQKQVGRYYASGVAGDLINPTDKVHTAVNCIAEGDVTVGNFVFNGSNPYTMASASAATSTAGVDTYALDIGAVGALNVASDGLTVGAQSTLGAFNATAVTASSVTGELVVPNNNVTSVKIGGVEVATIADGTVTAGTLTGTGTNSSFTVSETKIVGSDVVVSVTITWTGSATASAVKGIVQRVLAYPNWNGRSDGTLTIASGSNLSVIVKGSVYVNSDAAATAGQKVYASVTDGSVKTAAAGETVSGYVETNWKVLRDTPAGEIVAIGNWE